MHSSPGMYDGHVAVDPYQTFSSQEFRTLGGVVVVPFRGWSSLGVYGFRSFQELELEVKGLQHKMDIFQASSTLHPKTLHPKFSILNPQPSTLNLKP